MAFCITVSHKSARHVTTRIVVGNQENAEKIVNYCVAEGYSVLAQDLLGNMPTHRTPKERLRADAICISAGIRLGPEFN